MASRALLLRDFHEIAGNDTNQRFAVTLLTQIQHEFAGLPYAEFWQSQVATILREEGESEFVTRSLIGRILQHSYKEHFKKEERKAVNSHGVLRCLNPLIAIHSEMRGSLSKIVLGTLIERMFIMSNRHIDCPDAIQDFDELGTTEFEIELCVYDLTMTKTVTRKGDTRNPYFEVYEFVDGGINAEIARYLAEHFGTQIENIHVSPGSSALLRHIRIEEDREADQEQILKLGNYEAIEHWMQEFGS